MGNPQRTYTDDGKYNDYIDNLKSKIVESSDSMIIKSYQGQATLSATTAWVVAYTDIAATDVVLCQVTTEATAAYIKTIAISAGVGFTVTFNTAPGVGTFDWMVIRKLPVISL